MSFIPEVMWTGGVEPPQPEALALQAGELADAQHPLVEGGGRPDSNRRRRDHDPEYLPLYHGHSGDGRHDWDPTHPTSRLTSERSGRLSYAPVKIARVGFEPTVSSS
jgi:hypothetical protein